MVAALSRRRNGFETRALDQISPTTGDEMTKANLTDSERDVLRSGEVVPRVHRKRESYETPESLGARVAATIAAAQASYPAATEQEALAYALQQAQAYTADLEETVIRLLKESGRLRHDTVVDDRLHGGRVVGTSLDLVEGPGFQFFYAGAQRVPGDDTTVTPPGLPGG